MLLRKAVDEFLIDCRAGGLSAKTLCVYGGNLRRFGEYMGGIKLADPLVPHVRRYFAELQELELSPYTVDQHYRTLNTFFQWCVREGTLDLNPIDRVRRPKVPKRLAPRLYSEQIERLVDALKGTALSERNLAMTLLMIDSGLRVGEVVGLEMKNLHLNEQYAKVNGKGDKEREIPFGETVVEALERYLAVRPESSCGYVFLSQYGGPTTVMAVQLMLKRLKDDVGVDRLYPHLLRHTFARIYLEEGDLKTLQEILGHESSQTTADIYLAPDIRDLKRKHKQAGPIDRIFEGGLFGP